MTGAEMITHFLDVHQEPEDPGSEALSGVYSPMEVAEIAQHEICKQMVSLSIACRHVTVPQKWVGSSIALAFDCGQLPSRRLPEAELRKEVRVHIFDWGRSELNTPEKHADL